jgi:hypothetical protein
MSTNAVIPVRLSTGATVPFRMALSGKGVAYHAILNPSTGKAAGKFGVNVTPKVVGGDLPDSVEVLGQMVPLVRGTTTGKTPNPRRHAAGVPVVVDGEPKQFSIFISETKRGFNVRGYITNPLSGSGSALRDEL